MKVAAEISEQRGKRRFFASLFFAVLLGFVVRLILSPEKIESKIRDELSRSELNESLTFSTAKVSLANGWLPDFAIVLGRVEWRGPRHCSDAAPLRASSVRVPLRMLSLLRGVPAGGRATIDDLVVDIDGLKQDCDRGGGRNSGVAAGKTPDSAARGTAISTADSAEPATATAVLTGTAASGKALKNLPKNHEIWSEELQQKLTAMISGLAVTRAEIFFEDRMKSVVIENLKARWRGPNLEISTSLGFPPAAVFGENLPTFSVTGTIAREEIRAQIRADLSEGSLEASALLKPVVVGERQELDADVKLTLNNLPLSVVTPLFVKSGIVSKNFRPKFAWLDCKAEVQGIFSRLVVDYPVALFECAVSGKIGRMNVERAVREPNGDWRPFEIQFMNLDLAHVFDTFDIDGPSGVLSSFGQMTGMLSVASRSQLKGTARWEGAAIRFAGTEGVAFQPLAVGNIVATLENQRWGFELSDFKPFEGRADIVMKANLDSKTFHGDFDLALADLKLAPRVEKVLFNGTVAEISGTAKVSTSLSAKVSTPSLSKLKANLVMKGLQGSEIDSSEVRVEARLATPEPDELPPQIELSVRSVALEVAKSGRLFRILEPTLLGWPGEISREGQRLVLSSVAVRGQFKESGFHWSEAKATVGPRVSLTSRGRIGRDHTLESEIVAQYPLVSRLKWNVSGTWLNPVATVASPELGNLLSKAGIQEGAVTGAIPERLLGIGSEKAAEKEKK